MVEDMGLDGKLMVVGRETTLQSGSADLVCLAGDGTILIVEFKTGPQNSDFRKSVAQLLDYGAGLWSLEFEEFESGVAKSYFQSQHCPEDSPVWKGYPMPDIVEWLLCGGFGFFIAAILAIKSQPSLFELMTLWVMLTLLFWFLGKMLAILVV